MTYLEKLTYFKHKLRTSFNWKIPTILEDMKLINLNQTHKLDYLFNCDWKLSDDGHKLEGQVNEGILYIEMVYNIVKRAEKEGKL